MKFAVRLSKALLLGLVLAVSVCAISACGEKSEHSLALVPEKAATCCETGNTAYYTCSHCDKLFTSADGKTETTLEEVTTAKLPHDFTGDDCHVAAKDFSCTEDGNEEYWRCKTCGNAFADEGGQYPFDPVLKARHSFTHYTYVSPTIDAFGRKEYWLCSVCHKAFVDAEGKTELTDGTQIAKLPEYETEISVVIKTESGEAVSDTSDTVITLTSVAKTYKGVLLDGKLVKEEAGVRDETKHTFAIGAGVYAVHTEKDGAIFYDTELTIEENAVSAELTVCKAAHAIYPAHTTDGVKATERNGVRSFSVYAPWSDGVMNCAGIRLNDSAVTGKSYAVDFTLGVDGAFEHEWYNRALLVATDATDGSAAGIAIVFADDLIATIPARGDLGSDFVGSDVENAQESNSLRDAAAAGILRLRFIREDGKISLLYKSATSWQLIRSLSVGDGNADIRLAAGGTQTVTFSDFVFGTYHAMDRPGVNKTGKEAHYTQADGTIFTPDGAEKTEADIVIPAITETDRTIAVTADDGNKAVQVRFISNLTDKTQTAQDGVIAVQLADGVYAVHAEGYYDTELTLGENDTNVVLSLVALDVQKVGKTTADCVRFTANADGSGKKISFVSPVGNAAENYAGAKLTDSVAITGAHYGVDFTVRIVGGYTSDWANQFFIRATSAEGQYSGISVILYTPLPDVFGVNIGRMWHNMQPVGHASIGKEQATAFQAQALSGTLGLRVVRTDTQVKLYMRTQDGYELLSTQQIDGDAELTFGATGTQTVEFADIVTGRYVPRQNPDLDTPGKEAHFVTADGDLYTIDGQNTTDADLAIEAITEQNAVIGVTVYDKAGQAVADTSGIVVELKGAYTQYANLNIVEGKLSQTAYVYGAYTVTAKKEGTRYYVTELTVDGAAAQLYLHELEHAFIKANDSVDVSYVSFVADNTAAGAKKVIFNRPSGNDADQTFVLLQPTGQRDDVWASNNLTMEFTLKIDGEYSTDWLQRFSVGMSDTWNTCGVGLIFYADGINAGSFYPHCVPANHGALTADTAAAFKTAAADGSLRLKAVREGATVTLYMQSGSNWVELASRSDVTGNGRLTLCANGTLTYTVTDLTITVGGKI